MTKSKPQETMSKGDTFFVFAMGAVFGSVLYSFAIWFHGGTLSTAVENYATCLRLGAPEQNCRNKYFLLRER